MNASHRQPARTTLPIRPLHQHPRLISINIPSGPHLASTRLTGQVIPVPVSGCVGQTDKSSKESTTSNRPASDQIPIVLLQSPCNHLKTSKLRSCPRPPKNFHLAAKINRFRVLCNRLLQYRLQSCVASTRSPLWPTAATTPLGSSVRCLDTNKPCLAVFVSPSTSNVRLLSTQTVSLWCLRTQQRLLTVVEAAPHSIQTRATSPTWASDLTMLKYP